MGFCLNFGSIGAYFLPTMHIWLSLQLSCSFRSFLLEQF